MNFGHCVIEVTSSDIYIFVMYAARDVLCASSSSSGGFLAASSKMNRVIESNVHPLQSEEQKALLLHNLDPMFNIKAGFFFVADENIGLIAQMDRFSIFDYNAIKR